MFRSSLPLALLLAACGAPEPEGKPPLADRPTMDSPAPANVSDFSQPMTARGTEPFWAVRIDGTRLTLLRPDQPDVAFEAPGAVITPGHATWEAKAADGRTMRVTLYSSDCSDGMSDLSYPMTAEVEFLNETLRGCAAKTAALPREGG